MQWSDEALVLSVKRHGETSVIAELFTARKGRYLGLVRGGVSKRLRPVLQSGNIVNATWRARLEDHLGQYVIELLEPVASEFFDDAVALAGLNTLCADLSLFAERDPHDALYQGAKTFIQALRDGDVWPGLLVRFEIELLSELGFGLDLSKCAATGATSDLCYVSPKTGRAVSREAGLPYHDKLLRLPGFLRGDFDNATSGTDVSDGFALTSYFLQKQIYDVRGIKEPEARGRLIHYLKKSE